VAFRKHVFPEFRSHQPTVIGEGLLLAFCSDSRGSRDGHDFFSAILRVESCLELGPCLGVGARGEVMRLAAGVEISQTLKNKTLLSPLPCHSSRGATHTLCISRRMWTIVFAGRVQLILPYVHCTAMEQFFGARVTKNARKLLHAYFHVVIASQVSNRITTFKSPCFLPLCWLQERRLMQ